MELTYKKATLEDLELLTETRIQILRAANQLGQDTDMSEVQRESRDYYREALANNTHIAYLVFDRDEFVGAGGVSFYRVMPTYRNPTGWKAYIMNMYTHTDYRRKGIAYHTLDLLVRDSVKAGFTHITLEATDMGRPLYEKYGFVKMNDEMELPM